MADFLAHLESYLALAAAALACGSAAGVPFGIAASQISSLRAPLLSIANVGRVIPSLAILTFMVPLFGLGFKPALIALALLAIPPIAINTDLGFRNVSPAAIDAARGLGMTQVQVLSRVQWPLAFPVVFTGIRTAAAEVIASAVLAAFIGAGGLGEYVTTGLQANQPAVLWLGVGSIAVIALAAEFLLAFLQRRLETQA